MCLIQTLRKQRHAAQGPQVSRTWLFILYLLLTSWVTLDKSSSASASQFLPLKVGDDICIIGIL